MEVDAGILMCAKESLKAVVVGFCSPGSMDNNVELFPAADRFVWEESKILRGREVEGRVVLGSANNVMSQIGEVRSIASSPVDISSIDATAIIYIKKC